MAQESNSKIERIKARVEEITGKKVYGNIEFVNDTTNQLGIWRGHVVQMDDREFFILGDVMEPRFGLDEQPKYWVKRTIDMGDGKIRLLKLVFHEEFMAHVGPIRIRCFRSPEKESQVLELVKGDPRFMQGITMQDEAGNQVRVIDFIHGRKIYDHIYDLKIDHEEYYHTALKSKLNLFLPCMEGIQFLHEQNLCHGDIRNDHLIIDRETGLLRWIDFDLTQHYPDFDVWSLGNILQFLMGKGMISFHEVRESDEFNDSIKQSLTSDDAAAFYRYRIMNLRKVYPYVSKKLNDILMHFSLGTQVFYDSVDQMILELKEAMEELPGED